MKFVHFILIILLLIYIFSMFGGTCTISNMYYKINRIYYSKYEMYFHQSLNTSITCDKIINNTYIPYFIEGDCVKDNNVIFYCVSNDVERCKFNHPNKDYMVMIDYDIYLFGIKLSNSVANTFSKFKDVSLFLDNYEEGKHINCLPFNIIPLLVFIFLGIIPFL